MKIADTSRLSLREITTDDAAFILRLLNDPAFLQFVGDKQVCDLESAKNYILEGPVASYKTHGFGLYLVELIDSGEPIGMCGIIKREFLDHAEIGFAMMPEYRRKGYGFEAAQVTLDFAREELQLRRIVAITAENNDPSIKLLEKLSLGFDKLIDLPSGDKKIKLYARDL
jgi:ribosomal-protein-alanine N-acetyltransferase